MLSKTLDNSPYTWYSKTDPTIMNDKSYIMHKLFYFKLCTHPLYTEYTCKLVFLVWGIYFIPNRIYRDNEDLEIVFQLSLSPTCFKSITEVKWASHSNYLRYVASTTMKPRPILALETVTVVCKEWALSGPKLAKMIPFSCPVFLIWRWPNVN
jgi:hypothetical protein